MPPRPGDVVNGKYRIASVVGSGGMGIVMGATDLTLGRPVALKFLSPEKAQKAESIARFLREARAAAAITSEHVARVFEVGTTPEGFPFIAMEQLEGSDLAHVLETRGPLPIDEACDHLLEACVALAEAHTLGIVHRDLKPQNLFLTRRADGSPCVKVLDFGIATATESDAAPNLTSTDTVMGTPRYMSPEQVRSLKNVDARTDVWALGAILFELLTRAPVWDAPTATALCAMIAMDPPTPLRARRPDAPPGLEAIVFRCLEKDPTRRWETVGALADALASFASPRGRAAAMRVAKVAHGSLVTAPRPVIQSIPAGSGSSPSLALAPTQGATYAPWGAGSGPIATAPPAPPKAGGRVLVLVLGLAFGALVLIALLAVAGYVALKQDVAAQPATSGTASATVVVPPAPTTPAPTASGTSKTPAPPGPGPKPTPGTKDAGAPAPPPPPDAGTPPKPDDDLARRKQMAQEKCQRHTMTMQLRSDKTAAAKEIQGETCLPAQSLSPNSGSSTCLRQSCRNACNTLHDQACLQRLDFAERSNPLPY